MAALTAATGLPSAVRPFVRLGERRRQPGRQGLRTGFRRRRTCPGRTVRAADALPVYRRPAGGGFVFCSGFRLPASISGATACGDYVPRSRAVDCRIRTRPGRCGSRRLKELTALTDRPRQALLPISGSSVGVSYSHNYQASSLDTVDDAVGIAAEQIAPGALGVGGPSVRRLRDRLRRRLELEYEAGRRSGAALRIPAGRLFRLDQSFFEILKFPRHDQRRQEFGGAPPPTGPFWLPHRPAGAGAAEFQPTTPLRHLRRSVGRGSRSAAQRARRVPRRRDGVPQRATASGS